MVNGSSYAFFKSSRGLRQGLERNPSLFIIAEEALSRGLSYLFQKEGLVGFYKCGRSSLFRTHLLYADETLVFCNGSKRSISNLFGFLHKYDASSGQRINKSKSALFLSRKTTAARKIVMQNTSGISAKGFQITYLGAPLYSGKLKINYFEPLVSKENRRLGWKITHTCRKIYTC